MRILFFPVDCIPFHAETLDERPLGGTETAVIRLAEAFQQLGHDVFVLSTAPFPPESPVNYISAGQLMTLGQVDILFSVRGWLPLFFGVDAKRRFFWTGDSWTLPRTIGIGDHRAVNKMTAFLPVSDWHAKTMCESSGFPMEKTFVLRNGVHLADFEGSEVRHRRRLIYSSTPFRGLEYLPIIFKILKDKYEDLELHIFSSMAIYNKENPEISQKDHFQDLYKLLGDIPGVTWHGSILQKQLAREFMKSSILAYPCNFEETSCITAMEAQAAGCAIVTSDLAALPETVGEAGILVKGEPGSPLYLENFILALDSLLRDDALLEKYASAGKRQSLKTDWKTRAEEFLNYAQI